MPVTSPIASNIQSLSDSDGLVREHARRALVALGSASVEPLISALKDSDDQVRWEAAKALSEIGDPVAAPALVAALEDELFGVRWLAAEGLAAMGRDGLRALLPALMHHADSAVLRHGAHHVLRSLSNRKWRSLVMPIVTALESADASLAVPNAAHRALAELEESRNQELRT
jgi:HEAT repeat protein